MDGIPNYMNPSPMEAMKNTRDLLVKMAAYEEENKTSWSLVERIRYKEVLDGVKAKYEALCASTILSD